MISPAVAAGLVLVSTALGWIAGASHWHARYRDAQAETVRLRRAVARAWHAAEVARRRRDATPAHLAGALWAVRLVESALTTAEPEVLR